jgi:hypothetical protein
LDGEELFDLGRVCSSKGIVVLEAFVEFIVKLVSCFYAEDDLEAVEVAFLFCAGEERSCSVLWGKE